MSGKLLKFPEMVKGNGNVKELKLYRLVSRNRGDNEGNTISAYSSLIPLLYLSRYYQTITTTVDPNILGGNNIDNYLDGAKLTIMDLDDRDRILEAKQALLRLPGFIYAMIVKHLGSKDSAYDILSDFIKYDGEHSISAYSYGEGAINSSTKEMEQMFIKFSLASYSLPSYSGIMGTFTLSVGAVYYVMAAILPQNLYYQRLHIALTGAVDLSKVIFLIDERLEDENFEMPGLRKLYLGRLKPKMKETAGQLWFVPQSYIEHNCFNSKFKLQCTNRTDRAKEHESLVEIFKTYAHSGIIEMHRLYNPSSDSEQKKPDITGPLVDAVEDSSLVAHRFAELRITESPSINVADAQLTMPGHSGTIFNLVETARSEILETLGVPPQREGALTSISAAGQFAPREELEELEELPF